MLILRIFLLFLSVTAAVAQSNDALAAQSLETRVVRMQGAFDPTKAEELSPMADGEPRFSIAKYMEEAHVPPVPGSQAIWLPKRNVVVLRYPEETMELAASSLEEIGMVITSVNLRATVSIWQYEESRRWNLLSLSMP